MLKPVIESQEIVISLGGKQTIAFNTFDLYQSHTYIIRFRENNKQVHSLSNKLNNCNNLNI